MKKTSWRLTLSWNYENESKWLNEMSDKGWQLEKPGLFRYTFVQGEPGKYRYDMEYLDANGEKRNEYFAFLEETGIEIVGQLGNWAYYRKPDNGKPFAIFSDTASKIAHYKRILLFLLIITPLEAWFMAKSWVEVYRGTHDASDMAMVILLTLAVVLLASGILHLLRRIATLSKNG